MRARLTLIVLIFGSIFLFFAGGANPAIALADVQSLISKALGINVDIQKIASSLGINGMTFSGFSFDSIVKALQQLLNPLQAK